MSVFVFIDVIFFICDPNDYTLVAIMSQFECSITSPGVKESLVGSGSAEHDCAYATLLWTET